MADISGDLQASLDALAHRGVRRCAVASQILVEYVIGSIPMGGPAKNPRPGACWSGAFGCMIPASGLLLWAAAG